MPYKNPADRAAAVARWRRNHPERKRAEGVKRAADPRQRDLMRAAQARYHRRLRDMASAAALAAFDALG